MHSELARWIDAHDGIADRADATAAGFPPHAIRAATTVGAVRRIRRSWLATASAHPDLVAAAEAGARVACVSVARLRGWWMPEGVDTGVHLHRSPHARALPAPGRMHWSIPIAPTSSSTLVESTEDALSHIAGCLPREDAMVLWESAARIERIDPEALRAVGWRTVAARECAAAVTGLADSGLESIFAFRLRRLDVRLRLQVKLAGRHVDALIGERLVVQVDGIEFHSSAADRRRDAEHDAELRLRGYTVLRVTYAQVLHDWPAVERTIIRAIAAGLHR